MEAVPGAHCNGLPVSAVIYSLLTHMATTGAGRVRGIVDEADIRSGKISVIAPVDFMDYTVSEKTSMPVTP